MKKEKRPKHPKPHEFDDIDSHAAKLCGLLNPHDRPEFSIVWAIENELTSHLRDFSLEIWTAEKLGGVEAFTDFEPARIVVREDIYEGAYRNDAHCRFTLAHELGHLCLHSGFPRPRLAPELQSLEKSSAVRRVENEANHFAGAFLIPQKIANQFIDHPDRLARRCCVSTLTAAKNSTI